MKGIENISQQITAEAQAKAAAMLDEARQRAKEAREKGAQQAKAESEKMRTETAQRAEELLRRSERTAQLESKKSQLAARQKMIDLAYEKALAKVLTLNDEKYSDLLCSLCGQTGAKTGELLFSEKDQARAGGLVEKMNQQNGAQLTLSKQTAPIPGGFILRQGQVEINCALDAIVRSLEEQTAKDVAAILF